MSTELRAFHGDKKIKEKYLGRVEAHRKLDDIAQGNSSRCAVGCTLDGVYNHARYPVELGIPEHLAYLEDSIFEGLPRGGSEYRKWPGQFLEAIPVGADLSMVWPQFAVWLLAPGRGLPKKLPGAVLKACADVRALYGRRIKGDEPTEEQWRSAAEATRAARAARAAAAALAAEAAEAAEAAWAAWVARPAAAISQSKQLLKLLRAAPARRKARR